MNIGVLCGCAQRREQTHVDAPAWTLMFCNSEHCDEDGQLTPDFDLADEPSPAPPRRVCNVMAGCWDIDEQGDVEIHVVYRASVHVHVGVKLNSSMFV